MFWNSGVELLLDPRFLGHYNKGTLGWPIADLKGIDPSIYTHCIYIEDNAKTSRQPQRRPNPNIKEVVKVEVLKLLDVGIIYPIFNSQWVS